MLAIFGVVCLIAIIAIINFAGPSHRPNRKDDA